MWGAEPQYGFAAAQQRADDELDDVALGFRVVYAS